jgi:hypothetical protein
MHSTSITTIRRKAIQHADFLLLLTIFLFFRFCSVFFMRPGGYTRDYTDLIFYQGRASWQNFGLFPYRDYWSEYPPLFAWFSLWIDRVSRRIPMWEDERLWYAAVFGICTVLAETVTFVCLYGLAQRLHGANALRVAWLYAGLFLPVYFLGGWYDALPVATIFVCLWLLIAAPTFIGMVFCGLVAGIGGLLKLVPLAILAAMPLATRRWPARLGAGITAFAVMAAGYGFAYLHGPVMTAASVRSLVERTGWSTLYAWVNGYTRLGKVLGSPFDAAARVAQYDSIYPEWLVMGVWLALGASVLVVLLRRQSLPTPAGSPPLAHVRTIIVFVALTYTILLLAYPSWNPQYALYLLPFFVLLWPDGRGVAYALALSFLVLIEHPVYHNLIGPDYSPVDRQLITANYRQLFLLIIVARTLFLAALAVELLLVLFAKRPQLRWLPPALAMFSVLVLLVAMPQFGRAYVAGRLATSPLRPLALYLNASSDDVLIVSQQMDLGRRLRPFLENGERLVLFGGRPGRIDPLPEVAAAGPFVYIHTGNDDAELAAEIERAYNCTSRQGLSAWELWFCNGAASPKVATFGESIVLAAAQLPQTLREVTHLTLFWTTTADITQDYTVFVHVVDANGKMIGQWDQMPMGGAAPTTQWTVNQLVVDDYQVPVDFTLHNANQAGEPYRVLVGLYDAQSATRLEVIETTHPVADESLELAVFGGGR